MSNEKLYANGNLLSVVTFAIIVRWSVSLHPYSGQNKPPMFGDYEAQRHWMEITVNLPPEEWYLNTSSNDLMYWGLDYPPLTAYHSFINGKIAQFINPDFVKLHSSRGYESYDHKFFMRTSVIIPEIIIYFLSVIIFCNSIYKSNQNCIELNHGEVSDTNKPKTGNLKFSNNSVTYLALIAIILLYPGLILIDHGHFQYNSISLGFTVAAVAALVYNKFFLCSFMFCLALNYKQMSLYHSLPFFVYLLSGCFHLKKPYNIGTNIKKLFGISTTVILTFGVIWYPFLSDHEVSVQVVRRLFPLSRGVFEDKVSNIWCAVNVIYKVNNILTQIQMAKICIVCVLITSSFSLLNLFRYPTLTRLILSLINVSLSFFLFSYQVHEKSILLVALPVLLYFPFDPFSCFWFLTISNFSMLPLFLKDNLLIPFLSLSVLFTLFVTANVSFHCNSDRKPNKNVKKIFSEKNLNFFTNFSLFLSIFGCVILLFCSVLIKPPLQYPDLWSLLISIYCCFHFLLFFVYYNYIQIFKTLN